jgi:hypothetical protein
MVWPKLSPSRWRRCCPKPHSFAWDKKLQKIGGDDAVHFLEIRQAIADARGDLDGFLALEVRRPVWRQDPLKAAERLDEALVWLRREKKGGLAFATDSDIADGRINRVHDLERVRLEARILEHKKDRPAAQALRWEAFETTLNAGILRDYVNKLDDFLEFEELDKAFAVAAASPQSYIALTFFVAWPRLDQAAKLMLDKRDLWDGRHYGALSDAAAALGQDFPWPLGALPSLVERYPGPGEIPSLPAWRALPHAAERIGGACSRGCRLRKPYHLPFAHQKGARPKGRILEHRRWEKSFVIPSCTDAQRAPALARRLMPGALRVMVDFSRSHVWIRSAERVQIPGRI